MKYDVAQKPPRVAAVYGSSNGKTRMFGERIVKPILRNWLFFRRCIRMFSIKRRSESCACNAL